MTQLPKAARTILPPLREAIPPILNRPVHRFLTPNHHPVGAISGSPPSEREL